MAKHKHRRRIFAELVVLIASVPIWRGVWILMDYFSGGNKLVDATLSIMTKIGLKTGILDQPIFGIP